MAKERTSVTIAPWILDTVRKYAEANGLSVSTVLERGALREIAAAHSPAARAPIYGASTAQEDDERIIAEDIARAAADRRPGEAA
ncbi:hypothetical protein GCM10027187_40230 [Streptosporangium sandarakinum]|uniref:CopG family transcriptional regulator n=1 Tax=Streptosporangium sandarakinum TaxID=1260955 RepID=A0A852V938_9ACTN|nr:hypothetical protein [Streptosporangium sandarakinum]NYF44646.1 hypothetical protein [Streptosporangium sandarakinum]